MSSIRYIAQDVGGLQRAATGGDCVVEIVFPLIVTADTARTLTVSDISRGVLAFTGLTTARVLTTDTAANILAAFPNLAVGECVSLQIGISTAFAGTLAAGAGVTLAGKAAVPASGFATLYFQRTGAATVTCLAV